MPNLTTTDRALLTKALIEAAGKERQLHTALQVQIAAAQSEAIEGLLRGHLTVTARQIDALEDRIEQLTADLDSDGVQAAQITAQTASLIVGAANRLLALGKGPLQLLRGTSPADRQLRDLRDCYWNEAEEIAHYRVIETLAEQLGDETTATLARAHRAEEEAMQQALEELLPVQVAAVITREGGSPHHPAGGGAPHTSGRKRTSSSSAGSRSSSGSRRGAAPKRPTTKPSKPSS